MQTEETPDRDDLPHLGFLPPRADRRCRTSTWLWHLVCRRKKDEHPPIARVGDTDIHER